MLTTVHTLFVAGFEIFMVYTNYRPGMNFFDLASYVNSNRYIYWLLLIVANMVLLPSAVLLFRENGLSLKNEIFFRGLAKVFCDSVMGEMTALLLFNVMFAMLDWYNSGLSFVIICRNFGINLFSCIKTFRDNYIMFFVFFGAVCEFEQPVVQGQKVLLS